MRASSSLLVNQKVHLMISNRTRASFPKQHIHTPQLSGLARSPSSRRPYSVFTHAKLGGGKPIVELLTEDIPGKNELLSPKLNPEVRKRSEDVIARFSNRVTVGDVAAGAGLTLQQAEDALRALAADSLATLQVADNGEIVYVFDRNFKDTIRGKSLKLRLEPAVASVAQGAAYLGRVAFGTALITSVVAVYLAITVILTSNSKDNRDNRGGGGGGYYSGGPRIWFNISDILWYWDPFYYKRRAAIYSTSGTKPPMSFLESVFSFVFGDGDPNQEYDKRRWEAIGRYIQYRGGVVTAEELAPFLDLQPNQLRSSRKEMVLNESYVLPVLARLGGHPEVGPTGDIVYRFESLQQTAKATRTTPTPVAMERTWKLTEATSDQQVGVVALGVVNLVGVLFLSTMLQNPANVYALARNGLTWVLGSMPLLQSYAAAFFAIPLVRWFMIKGRNAVIEGRNAARGQALKLVQNPDDALKAKLKGAEQQAQQRVITERDVVFRSDKAVDAQPRDIEGESWEAKLERRASERDRKSSMRIEPSSEKEPVRKKSDGWW